MVVKTRDLAAMALVVCASLAVLALQGATEWFTDLIVSASAGLAGRLKARSPATSGPEPTDGPTALGWGRSARRKPRYHRAIRRPARLARAHARRVGPLAGWAGPIAESPGAHEGGGMIQPC